jgi:hypothetical protein
MSKAMDPNNNGKRRMAGRSPVANQGGLHCAVLGRSPSPEQKTMMTTKAKKEWTNKGRWLAYADKPIPSTKEDLWPALSAPEGWNNKYVERLQNFVASLSDAEIQERIEAARHGHGLAMARRAKAESVIERYQKITDGAREASKRVVKGKTHDRYCGSAIVYVSDYKHELARALWALKGPFAPDHWSSRMFAAKVEIAAPEDSQSMTGWEESARAAAKYLNDHGVPAKTHSWAD